MSLRTRLLLLIALATLVPAILLGIRFIQTRAAEIDTALAELAEHANNIGDDLDKTIQGTAQLHFGLARSIDLDSSNKAECSAFLSAVLQKYPQYTGILTILPDGSLFCDSLQTDRKLDLKDREYFQKALVTKGAVTLQPVFGRLTGTSVLQIAYPARSSSGQLKFILLASFSLQKFAAFHTRQLSNTIDILLVDKNGLVLVSPSGPNWSERTGTSIANTDLFRFAASKPAGKQPVKIRCKGCKIYIDKIIAHPLRLNVDRAVHRYPAKRQHKATQRNTEYESISEFPCMRKRVNAGMVIE